MSQAMEASDQALLDRYAPKGEEYKTPMLFITAAIRTGSTPIYQLMINLFGLYYFSNFVVEHFAEHPAVGTALDLAANPLDSLGFDSNYGKTDGLFGPSEASFVFKNWFGGNQPSQSHSARVLPEKEEHMKRSLASVCAMAGRPLVTKNAWNIFRIPDLARMFPDICFLWFRRDVVRSAASDLEARYRWGGPHVWNSATSANYKEIQKLPYWEQVVEQQYEYNHAMEQAFTEHCPGRYVELWYEDMCGDSAQLSRDMEKAFASWGWDRVKAMGAPPRFSLAPDPPDMEEDIQKIQQYVDSRPDRFKGMVYSGTHPILP